MPDVDTIEQLTGLLLRARETGHRVEANGLRLPDYDEALAVQRRVWPALGALSGFKVGAFRPGQPAMAPIPSARTYVSGSEVPARDRLGIELEIGFEVLQAPKKGMRDMPQACFLPRIVLELCNQRLAGETLDPALKLADMQLNEGLVIGPALNGWDGSDFTSLDARLRCGDTTVIDGSVEVPGGSALENLWTLLDHLGTHCGGIDIGHILITGSVSGLRWFPPGTDVEGRIAGFDSINCRIVDHA